MYIQITTRCNMECVHCCYSCTSEGEDMDRETFILARQLAEAMGTFIDFGGGEPTLHPLFWDFIGIALKHPAKYPSCVATNGKIKEDALALAKLAKRKVLYADLSLDPYHEPIDPEVVRAFEKPAGPMHTRTDYRGIRDITHGGTIGPAPFGRATSWADPKDIRCPGNDLSVTPDGTIYACGCRTKTYGTVYAPRLPEEIPKEWCPDKLGWGSNRGG